MSYHQPIHLQLMDDFLEWLFADKYERKIFKYVPRYCRQCELMNICRDSDNNWKCRNGCMQIREDSINFDMF